MPQILLGSFELRAEGRAGGAMAGSHGIAVATGRKRDASVLATTAGAVRGVVVLHSTAAASALASLPTSLASGGVGVGAAMTTCTAGVVALRVNRCGEEWDSVKLDSDASKNPGRSDCSGPLSSFAA